MGSSDNKAPRMQEYLRQAIEETIRALGGPISKTINWHMNNRGILSDSRGVDINIFYLNLRELLGPGADMIMEETLERLCKKFGLGSQSREGPAVDKILKIMGTGVEA